MPDALASNIKEVGSMDLSGGLVTVRPPHQLQEGQASFIQDFDPFVNFGSITPRLGMRYYIQTTETLSNSSSGLYEYIKSDSTNKLYLVIGTKILEVSTPNTQSTKYVQNSKAVERIDEYTGSVTPSKFKITAHGYTTGDTVYVYGITASNPPNSTYNNLSFTITVVDADNFTLNGTTAVVTTFAVSGVGYVAKTNGSPTPLGGVNFCTFSDLCIAVSPAMTTLKSSGTTFSPLLGTPPSNAKFIATHKARVFIAHHSVGSSPERRNRVSFCAQNNAEDWTTITGAATDAGFIDVGKDDGDVITGMVSLGNVLVVFKNQSTWMIQGSGPDNFTVRPISTRVGCIASNSVVVCDQFAIFLSDLGVYSVTANGNGIVRMSYNIQPSIDSYSRAQRVLASAGRYKTQYWLSIPAANYDTYVLDYVYGNWTQYGNISSKKYLTRQDGTFLWQTQANFDSTDVMQGGIGHYDESKGASHAVIVQTAVNAIWVSKDYDFDSFVNRKTLHDIVVVAQTMVGENVLITNYLNGLQNATVYTFDLSPATTETIKLFKLGRHFADTQYKNFIKFRFDIISSANAPAIYGYSATAEVYPRENG